MAVTKYELINKKSNRGVFMDSLDLINLIKICEKRNKYYFNKLIEDYEYLENEKFNIDLIRRSEKIEKTP